MSSTSLASYPSRNSVSTRGSTRAARSWLRPCARFGRRGCGDEARRSHHRAGVEGFPQAHRDQTPRAGRRSATRACPRARDRRGGRGDPAVTSPRPIASCRATTPLASVGIGMFCLCHRRNRCIRRPPRSGCSRSAAWAARRRAAYAGRPSGAGRASPGAICGLDASTSENKPRSRSTRRCRPERPCGRDRSSSASSWRLQPP